MAGACSKITPPARSDLWFDRVEHNSKWFDDRNNAGVVLILVRFGLIIEMSPPQ
jgi:hypothetical protein